ncbi:MAG: substrate-binding domain-containing protein [Anaerolineae bacterium]|nr:substrate-binding domain-containing protein [Anaerolineae bacterium]
MAERIRFIDRDKELAWIKNAVLDTGKARALYIYASGGIGKTRLLQEIHTMLRAPDYNVLLDVPRDRKLTIAVVNEFCQTVWADAFMRGVRATAANMGIDLLTTDAQFKIPQMVQDLKGVIKKAPDAIVVRLGTDPRLRDALEKACSLKVLTLDNFLREMTGLTARIVTQEDQSAMAAAQQLVKDIQYHGDVAILTGRESALQEQRRALFKRFMGAYSDIKLHVEELVMGERMSEQAYDRTLALVREQPNLKAFWVTWDEFMPGVLRALRDAGRADVGVYGFDVWSPGKFTALATPDSPWRASVALDPEAIGRSVIHLAALAACGKPLQRHYEIRARFFNRETVLQTATQPPLSQTEPPYLPNLVTLDIIDFDDQAFRDEKVFAYKLARMIGQQHFGDFYKSWQALTELRKQEEISAFVLDKHELAVESAFIACLKQVSAQQRTVMVLDTVEKAHEVIPFISQFLATTDNVVVVMAGRPDPKSLQLLETTLGDRLESEALKELDEDASRQYLQEKQVSLHTVLDDPFKENLLRLAQGKPILMELAVEWHAHGLVLPWMKKPLPEANGEQPWDIEDFESQLVHHIGQVETLSDWVTLLLARVFPLDKEGIGQLLELNDEKTARAWHEVQDLVFIKHLPGGRISLHDRMRELVNEYVWPDFDRDKSRRYEINRSAVTYLQQQIARQEATSSALGNEDLGTGTPQDLDSWRKRQEHMETIWLLREQLLQHQLDIDLDASLDLFFDLFEEATDSYRYALRMNLVDLVAPYYGQLAPKVQCDVLLCKARALRGHRRHEESITVLEEVLQHEAVEPHQQADAHIQLANAVIRQGELERGIQEFAAAVEISQSAEDKRWWVKAENGLGWAYRLTANLDEARRHYESALKLALEENLRDEQAKIYNNLGFLYAYNREERGYLGIAQSYCEESLRLATELEDERSVGCAYSTMGCVCFMGGELERALENFNLALEIFERKGDEDWQSQVYAWRGAVWINDNLMNLEKAQNDLEIARRINVPKDQPIILSRLALINLLRGNLDKAEKMVNECQQRALELPDPWYQWISIRDLARIARYRNDFSRLPALEQQRQRHLKTWHNVDQRAHGMLLLELGCLALGLSDHQKAVNYFIEGMKVLISVGQYGGDRPAIFLQRIEQQFLCGNSHLSGAQIATFGQDLLAAWKSGPHYIRYPDVRHVYEHWANWQEAPDA